MKPGSAAARLASVLVAPETPIAEALARLDRAGTGVLLLADAERRLVGVLTDGDIRRAILGGIPLTEPADAIASRRPVVARPGQTGAELLARMDHAREYPVHHLPLVSPGGAVVGLVLRSDLVASARPPLSAVIMAGGFGTRLRPLTERVPKPMLPVGDRPLLKVMLGRLRAAGIRQVHVTTHYLANQIRDHFGDGGAFGVDLRYVHEDEPLGTAGGLALMDDAEGPLLVLNGDVLTSLPFQGMLAYHREAGADATIGVRRYEMQVPYGVVDCDGPAVRGLREKPSLGVLVNAGVYLLEPSARRAIPRGCRFDMTDLIGHLLAEGRKVVSYPIVERWVDIGRLPDYEHAQDEVRTVGV